MKIRWLNDKEYVEVHEYDVDCAHCGYTYRVEGTKLDKPLLLRCTVCKSTEVRDIRKAGGFT